MKLNISNIFSIKKMIKAFENNNYGQVANELLDFKMAKKAKGQVNKVANIRHKLS